MPCARCRAADVLRVKRDRMDRKARGLCIYCGVEKPEEGRLGCPECLRVKRLKEANRKRSLCLEHSGSA